MNNIPRHNHNKAAAEKRTNTNWHEAVPSSRIEQLHKMQRHTVAVTELVKLLKEINQRLLLPTHNMFTQHGREDAFKKDLVQEVTKKNHLPVLAISTDGVVRFTIFEDKLHLVDGKKLPSSISGQTIEQSWNIIKKDYAERIEKIAHALI